MAAQVLAEGQSVTEWAAANAALMTRWDRTMDAVSLTPDMEFAGLSMTVRKLVDLLSSHRPESA